MSPCQEWDGCRTKTGYGQIRYGGKTVYTHRLAWALFHGVNPGRMHIRHACDNPPCCNPEHLELGTAKDNSDDKWKRGRAVVSRTSRNVRIPYETIQAIRAEYKLGSRQVDLAAKFSLSQTHVSDIVRNKWRTSK